MANTRQSFPAVWPAPAKLNLFLHITGRRPDGYHLLQTVFQFIDYCDELRFDVREDGRIRRVSRIEAVAEAQDLTVRAAKLLQSESGTSLGVDIHIDKHIPMGGGLGGGSSDAATTLVALNALWGLGYPLTRLAELGLTLGADVPVFVQGHSAWAEGVGERLEAVDLPESWYLIVFPACHVATGEIFGSAELTRNAPPIKIRDFLAGHACNVCEPVVRVKYPEIDKVFSWLSDHAGNGPPARLTGTGACVFATFDSNQAARQVAGQLPDEWQGIVVQGKNISPLHECLK